MLITANMISSPEERKDELRKHTENWKGQHLEILDRTCVESMLIAVPPGRSLSECSRHHSSVSKLKSQSISDSSRNQYPSPQELINAIGTFRLTQAECESLASLLPDQFAECLELPPASECGLEPTVATFNSSSSQLLNIPNEVELPAGKSGGSFDLDYRESSPYAGIVIPFMEDEENLSIDVHNKDFAQMSFKQEDSDGRAWLLAMAIARRPSR